MQLHYKEQTRCWLTKMMLFQTVSKVRSSFGPLAYRKDKIFARKENIGKIYKRTITWMDFRWAISHLLTSNAWTDKVQIDFFYLVASLLKVIFNEINAYIFLISPNWLSNCHLICAYEHVNPLTISHHIWFNLRNNTSILLRITFLLLFGKNVT